MKFFFPTSIAHHFKDRLPVELVKATAAGLPAESVALTENELKLRLLFPTLPQLIRSNPQRSAAIRSKKKFMSPTSDALADCSILHSAFGKFCIPRHPTPILHSAFLTLYSRIAQ